jgi:hypothetical protein
MVNPKGAAIFCIYGFKALGRSLSYALRTLKPYLSKTDSRSIDEIDRS